MAAPAELQCSPHALQFSAHVGQDAPLRFTLFNPHPSQRIAFKIKTTASSTYRVWPNCGPLEPGETQRIQILLLGTKVDLSRPEVVEECNYDRFQVQYVPLPDGMAYDGGLYKQMPGLVRDIKLNVSVVVLPPSQSVSTSGTAPGEPVSPWENMVRVGLLRMLADEDRDATHNAACLTKFTELLLLNGIISTQQMWAVFNLVGDLFEGAGASGEQVLSKVEQWLDAAEAPTDAGPPASEPPSPAAARPAPRRRSQQVAVAALHPGTPLAVAGNRRGARAGAEPSPETPDRPEPRSSAAPRRTAIAAALNGGGAASVASTREHDGEMSYPESLASRAPTDESTGGAEDTEGANVDEDGPPAKAIAAPARVAITAMPDVKVTPPAPPNVASRRLDDDGFGSAHSSVVDVETPSHAEAADEDEEEEEEDEERAEERQPGRSASLPASPSAPAGSASEADSLEAQLAAVRAQAKAMATVRANSSMLNGSDGPLPSPTADVHLIRNQSPRKNGFKTARDLKPTPTKDPAMLTLEERIARLEKQTHVVSLHADSGALSDIPDEAFAPEMLEEARRSVAKRSSVATGPHTLSFAERAAIYGRVVIGAGAGGSLGESDRRTGSSRGSRVDSDGSGRRVPKVDAIAPAVRPPVRRSLLAEGPPAARDLLANHAAAAMAAASAEDREDDAALPAADEEDDVPVPRAAGVADVFVSAGARAGKRSSVRGLDVLASVNPDGYRLPRRVAVVDVPPSHIPGMAAYARHMDGADEDERTAREDADYRKWAKEDVEDDGHKYPGDAPAARPSERDIVGDSDSYGGEETPPQAPTPSGPSFTPSGSGINYRQGSDGGTPKSATQRVTTPTRRLVVRWRGAEQEDPKLKGVTTGPMRNRLATRSLQSQPDRSQGVERSHGSHGTTHSAFAGLEDSEMRLDSGTNGSRTPTRAAMDLTEPVRQNSSLLNHLATADPTLPGSQRDARMSSDEIPAAASFEAAVGSPRALPLRQTKSMAPAVAGSRVLDAVARYDRGSADLGVTLERRSEDGQPGSPAGREVSQTSSQPDTPSGSQQRLQYQGSQPQAGRNNAKKAGVFKRIGNALTARAQQAATQAGQSGYYYV